MPDPSPVIAIFAQKDGQAAYLADIVRIAGFKPETGIAEGAILSLKTENAALAILEGDEVKRTMALPVRGGQLIAVLKKLLEQAGALPDRLVLGDGALDTRDGLWLREGESPVRLTEKEVAILLKLARAAGRAVSRQSLLDEVWAYAQGVETHTLETHIYRLRQKIEIDPAAPKILLTQEDGYYIRSGENG